MQELLEFFIKYNKPLIRVKIHKNERKKKKKTEKEKNIQNKKEERPKFSKFKLIT